MSYPSRYYKLVPVKLILGHEYKINNTGYAPNERVYKLIKTTNKGYKFLNLKTNTCRPTRNPLYPMSQATKSRNNLWFLMPDMLQIIDVTDTVQKELFLNRLKTLYSNYHSHVMNGASGMEMRYLIQNTQEIMRELNISVADSKRIYNPHNYDL